MRLDVTLAQERAEEFEVDRGCSVDELLGDADIEIVVNLTVPKVHASVNQQILDAGKHAHTEKPFAVDKADGKAVLALAQQKGLRTGGAPDTFLGGGIQTCRKLIEVNRWRKRHSWQATVTRAGTRIQTSITRLAAGRCSIWVRTT